MIELATKNVLLILGNGVSIDFINQVKSVDNNLYDINLTNLFDKGDLVPWPSDDVPGFLSYHHTPSLWTLGAKPGCKTSEAQVITENIMTCANVFSSLKNEEIKDIEDSIYCRAYLELAQYLRYLFIYYNSKVNDDILNRDKVKSWGWYRLIDRLNNDESVEKIYIISYNYDIFFERILKSNGIDFIFMNFEDSTKKSCKIELIKPHGSINIRSKKIIRRDGFTLKYKLYDMDCTIEDLCVDYDVDNKGKLSNVITLVPPYGASERYPNKWSAKLRACCEDVAKTLKEEDIIFIGGLSYSNVDRLEIDRLLLNINRKGSSSQ